MVTRPLDTSTLGPVKVDSAQLAAKARVIREALAAVRDGTTDPNVSNGLDLVVIHADDDTLRYLGRLIR